METTEPETELLVTLAAGDFICASDCIFCLIGHYFSLVEESVMKPSLCESAKLEQIRSEDIKSFNFSHSLLIIDICSRKVQHRVGNNKSLMDINFDIDRVVPTSDFISNLIRHIGFTISLLCLTQ